MLTQGKTALVDDADHERLAAFKWFAIKRPRSATWYAAKNGYVNGKRRQILMHRFILGLHEVTTPLVDHKDRDGLNNQRENLRACTQSQNAQNRQRTRSHKSSRYHGVSWVGARVNKWIVQIQVEGAKHRLGYFPDEADAAKAYDKAALLHFGDFAATNFPREEYESANV